MLLEHFDRIMHKTSNSLLSSKWIWPRIVQLGIEDVGHDLDEARIPANRPPSARICATILLKPHLSISKWEQTTINRGNYCADTLGELASLDCLHLWLALRVLQLIHLLVDGEIHGWSA